MEKECEKRRNFNAYVFLFGIIFLSFLVAASPSFHTSGTTSNLEEDQSSLFQYNLSANVSNQDNETLVFSIENITSVLHGSKSVSYFSWIYLNSSTGILSINASNNNHTGMYNVSIRVLNTRDPPTGAIDVFYFNVSSSNDAPAFINLVNRSINRSFFELILYAVDEENNTPIGFNATFLSCVHNSLNPPTGDGNCTLFNLTYYNNSATNISFSPSDDMRGEYLIKFSVNDSFGASRSQIVNWTLSWNYLPFFTYVCDNERNTSEDSGFSCRVNATDYGEAGNVTFMSNYTWFTFNNTLPSSIINLTGSAGNFSAIVNFTPSDADVGNWSVNLTIQDSERIMNYTTFYFYISNIHDPVGLDNIIFSEKAYITNNYTLYVNASDNDLLIPDKSVYNESLSFSSNLSWVSISPLSTLNNITTAIITINAAFGSPGQNYTVGINVNDSSGNSASKAFNINISGNNAPSWRNEIVNNYTLNEGESLYLNLSSNVSDPDEGQINFSFSNETSFNSFSINRSTGIINFTASDLDVGDHIITINASDGITAVPFVFNITIYNLNDNPYPESPVSATNAWINPSTGNVYGMEDNATELFFFVQDEDFKIPSEQSGFYNEELTLNASISGPNATILSFIESYGYPLSSAPNRTRYVSIFTPKKADTGNYTITINITDKSNYSTILSFNMTVSSINHPPSLTAIENYSSSITEAFFLDVNSSDIEDINDSYSGSNLTYSITNLTRGGNFLTINRSTGIINFTLNSSLAGSWTYNVTVNDTEGVQDSKIFTLKVYNYPIFISPSSSTGFSMLENSSYQFSFSVNHTIGDSLTYSLYVNGVLRNQTTSNGNGSLFSLGFTSNFSDETTCTGSINVTLNASNSKLSNSTNWRLAINHSDYPLTFASSIGGSTSTLTGGSPISIALSDYYSDIDAADVCINQSITFWYSNIEGSSLGEPIGVNISHWMNASVPRAVFSASSAGSSNFSIFAYEYNYSNSSQLIRTVYSNNFSVQISAPSSSPTSSSGGGGGGSAGTTKTQYTSLKIIVPGPVSSDKNDKLILPISIVNEGSVEFKEIILRATIAKDGRIRNDILASFDRTIIPSLMPKVSENMTLIVDVNTKDEGLYEILINASVKEPSVKDFAKVFLTVDEGVKVKEKLILTEELIADNPECMEIKELADEAKSSLMNGDMKDAEKKLDQAINACRNAISQKVTTSKRKRSLESLPTYLLISILGSFALGSLYYFYKRMKLKKALEGY